MGGGQPLSWGLQEGRAQGSGLLEPPLLWAGVSVERDVGKVCMTLQCCLDFSLPPPTHLSPRAAIFRTQVRSCLATEARILPSQYVILSNNLVASGSLSGKGSRRPAAESGRANLESRRFRPSDTPPPPPPSPHFSDLFAGSQGERCGGRSSRGCLLCGCQGFNLSSGLYQLTPRPAGLPPSPLTWHLIHAHELEHSPHAAAPGFPDPA